MSRRTLALVAGAGVAVVVAVAGIALGMHNSTTSTETTASATSDTTLAAYVATASGSAERTGLRAQIRQLMSNDEFRAEAANLRDQHQAATNTWWSKYGDNPRSEEALAAQEKLRDEQQAAMTALLKKYGVDTTAMEQARAAAEEARAKLEALMQDDTFRADLNALRDTHEKAMDAWWDKYGDTPRSDDAIESMQKIRDDMQADMQALLKKYGVDTTAIGRGMMGLFGSGMGRDGMMYGLDGDFGGGRGGRGGMMGPGGPRCAPGSQETTASPAATQSL